jgi:hypothetical protein
MEKYLLDSFTEEKKAAKTAMLFRKHPNDLWHSSSIWDLKT